MSECTRITALLPAPGWRVFRCYFDDNNAAQFAEMPVVGWAAIREESDVDDKVKLIFYDESERGTTTAEIFNFDACQECVTELPPGQAFDQERKNVLEERTRRIIARGEKRRAALRRDI